MAPLRLGLCSLVSAAVLAPVLRALDDRFGAAFELSLIRGTSERLTETLLRGELDAALLPGAELNSERLNRWFLFEDGLVVLAPADHRLATLEAVSIPALHGETVLVDTEEGCALRRALGRLCGGPLPVRHRVSGPESAAQLAAAGFGVALATGRRPTQPGWCAVLWKTRQRGKRSCSRPLPDGPPGERWTPSSSSRAPATGPNRMRLDAGQAWKSCLAGLRRRAVPDATLPDRRRTAVPRLIEQLDELRNQRSRIGELHAAYLATVAELRRTPFLDRALRVGEAFPDFLLPNAEGRLLARDDLVAQGSMVVTFFAAPGARTCAIQLAALEEALPDIAAAGASLVAITPETGGRAAEAKARHGAHYEVLADVDQGLGTACGVLFRLPAPYRRLLESRGVDLAERQGHEGWFLPVPATFVVDRGGVVRWAFMDVDFTRRAEPDDILAALAAL